MKELGTSPKRSVATGQGVWPPRGGPGHDSRIVAVHALVVRIQNRLLRAPVERTDAEIMWALGMLGGDTCTDRVYVFQFDGERLHNTHEWCAPGIPPAIEQLQDLSTGLLKSWKAQLEQQLPILVPDVDALEPASPERGILEPQGIRSMVAVPMQHDGRNTGFVGFDAVSAPRTFSPEEIFLLQSVAETIASLLLRRKSEQAIRSAQRKLAEERSFLRSILSTSLSGFLVFDDQRRVVFANEAAAAALGIPEDLMLGRVIAQEIEFSTFEGTPVPIGELPLDVARSTGKPVRDFRIATSWRGGPRKLLSMNALAIGGLPGEGRRVVLSLEDISLRFAAETEREAALEEARRGTEAKSLFLARMSHELRTPLNGVLGIAELLDDMIPDGEARQLLDILRDSGGLLVSIIDDLLDMSKIEADQLRIESVPFTPAVLARRIEAVHGLKATEKGIAFRLRCGPGADCVRMGDPHRVSQILHNLVSNAIKFTAEGSVTLRVCRADDGRIAFEVEDTGIGMTADDVSRMFDEFGQVDISITRRFGGTGLGMAITRRLVTLMGGEIDVHSAPNRGTTARILLSLDLAGTDADLIDPDRDQREDPVNRLDGLRVIAADDNRTNRVILEAMLRPLGIETTLCPGGEELLRDFEAGRYDLCILDISMPGMDGIAALHRLREIEARAGTAPVPVLAYTANAMLHQIGAYLAAGFDGCLTKPLQRDQLVAAVRRSIEPRL